MRPTGFSAARARLSLSVPLVALAVRAGTFPATQPATDVCAWLTPAQLQNTFGQPFNPPEQSVASPISPGQPAGTHCEYETKKASPMKVIMIAYTETSPAQAKATFEKMASSLASTPKASGIGDESYVAEDNALRVLKGKVRYYVDISPDDKDSPAREQQQRDLALAIAAQL